MLETTHQMSLRNIPAPPIRQTGRRPARIHSRSATVEQFEEKFEKYFICGLVFCRNQETLVVFCGAPCRQTIAEFHKAGLKTGVILSREEERNAAGLDLHSYVFVGGGPNVKIEELIRRTTKDLNRGDWEIDQVSSVVVKRHER